MPVPTISITHGYHWHDFDLIILIWQFNTAIRNLFIDLANLLAIFNFMKNILLSWLGNREVGGHDATYGTSHDRIRAALRSGTFDSLILLNSNYEVSEVSNYLSCLQNDFKNISISVTPPLTNNPWDYSEIFDATNRTIESIFADYGNKSLLTLHLGPGTSAMTAVWIILAKTKYPATLIRTESKDKVIPVDIPFDISAEFFRNRDKAIERLQTSQHVDITHFGSIIRKSKSMEKAIEAARRFAQHRTLPILLEGESGVGKELFAKAIHNSSPRAGKPYRKINCGAIPKDLIESELFGHIKGAFSGAITNKIGIFEATDGGTLFLDEIGELPPYAQVKLLAVLQDKEVTRIGATEPKKIDVRIISATNRELQKEVAANRFRLDLFHRIAGGKVAIPPLRKREGDFNFLTNFFLDKIGAEFNSKIKISPQAINYMLSYRWPGNVRELEYTLQRASCIANNNRIELEDIRNATLEIALPESGNVLDREISNGFNIDEALAEVERYYLSKALEIAGGNQTKAGKLIGLSRQNFNNRAKKYENVLVQNL